MCGWAMRFARFVGPAAVALLLLLLLLVVAPPASAQPRGRAEDESAAFVIEAREAIRKNKLDDAARSLDQAILLNPRSIEAYVLRSVVHQLKGKFAEGVAVMRRARAQDPSNPEVQARLGALLIKTPTGGSEGLQLLEAVAKESPPRPEALYALGEYWRARGAHRRAIVALRQYNEKQFENREQAFESTILEADSRLRARMPRLAKDTLAPLESLARDPKSSLTKPQRQRIALLGALIEAAMDCAKARPRLDALDDSLTRGVLLVRGRCALELNRVEEAQEMARRYLSSPPDRIAGAVLLADVYAAQGNVISAREVLTALAGELVAEDKPGRPKLSSAQRRDAQRTVEVRLAGLLRRGGELGRAIERLRAIGPPASPEQDPRWWLELGLALLARDDLVAQADYRARLAAILTDEIREPSKEELFERRPEKLADARLWALLGELELRLGEPAAAELSLEHSLRLRPLRAVQELHARAAVQRRVGDAARKLVAGDAAGAEAELLAVARYSGSRPNGALDGALWRNLGIARLMQQRGAPAVEALQRANAVAPSAINAMLLGRAFAMARDRARARAAYEQAAKLAAGADRLEVALDRASFELSANEPASAVAELDAVEDALVAISAADASAEGRALTDRYRSARASARHVAGVAALRAGQAGRALALLVEGSRPDAPAALRCDYALAVLAARGGDALRVLKNLGKQECGPLTQVDALKILAVAADSETPSRAKAALSSLQRLAPKQGASRTLWSEATRVVAQNAAAEAFRVAQGAGLEVRAAQLVAAREYLRRARSASAPFGDDELELSRLAIDLDVALELSDRREADRRITAMLPALERLAQRLPEADVHLGLAYDHLHSDQALVVWRRARRSGVRLPQLGEWIKAKERLEPRGEDL
jgi:predicted Zn-dependent protease